MVSSVPVGSREIRQRQYRLERNNRYYTIGVFLMTIHPCVEGRFFAKEFVFDNSGNNGRLLFGNEAPVSGKTTLTHVIESMDETE